MCFVNSHSPLGRTSLDSPRVRSELDFTMLSVVLLLMTVFLLSWAPWPVLFGEKLHSLIHSQTFFEVTSSHGVKPLTADYS